MVVIDGKRRRWNIHTTQSQVIAQRPLKYKSDLNRERETDDRCRGRHYSLGHTARKASITVLPSHCSQAHRSPHIKRTRYQSRSTHRLNLDQQRLLLPQSIRLLIEPIPIPICRQLKVKAEYDLGEKQPHLMICHTTRSSACMSHT